MNKIRARKWHMQAIWLSITKVLCLQRNGIASALIPTLLSINHVSAVSYYKLFGQRTISGISGCATARGSNASMLLIPLNLKEGYNLDLEKTPSILTVQLLLR